MSDTFALTGTYQVTPAGTPSIDPTFVATISEEQTLVRKHYDEINLAVDTPVVVPFGGVTNASIVAIKVLSGGSGGTKVTARLTSADGATQAVPVDDFLIVESQAVPFTAIDLTRLAGNATLVGVFLGEA